MDVKYYRSIDSDAVYACVGPMAGDALFVLRQPPAGEWEFLVPNSPAWDAAHQGIYRNSRVTAVKPDFAAALPPLPEIPRGPFPEWKEHFLPAKPIRAAKYPSVAGFVARASAATATLFVVLYEDGYETAFGDGEFHYFKDVFVVREDAERLMDQKHGEWERLHLRSMTVKLDQGAFAFPELDLRLFDRYKPEEVLAAMEARLRG
jgi:hypothetical protein